MEDEGPALLHGSEIDDSRGDVSDTGSHEYDGGHNSSVRYGVHDIVGSYPEDRDDDSTYGGAGDSGELTHCHNESQSSRQRLAGNKAGHKCRACRLIKRLGGGCARNDEIDRPGHDPATDGEAGEQSREDGHARLGEQQRPAPVKCIGQHTREQRCADQRYTPSQANQPKGKLGVGEEVDLPGNRDDLHLRADAGDQLAPRQQDEVSILEGA